MAPVSGIINIFLKFYKQKSLATIFKIDLHENLLDIYHIIFT